MHSQSLSAGEAVDASRIYCRSTHQNVFRVQCAPRLCVALQHNALSRVVLTCASSRVVLNRVVGFRVVSSSVVLSSVVSTFVARFRVVTFVARFRVVLSSVVVKYVVLSSVGHGSGISIRSGSQLFPMRNCQAQPALRLALSGVSHSIGYRSIDAVL